MHRRDPVLMLLRLLLLRHRRLILIQKMKSFFGLSRDSGHDLYHDRDRDRDHYLRDPCFCFCSYSYF